jgi:prophage regulatory protein
MTSAYSHGVEVRLVGTYEIAVLLGGVSRQRVDQITRRASFPPPLANLAQGRVWLAADVETWSKIHRQQPA